MLSQFLKQKYFPVWVMLLSLGLSLLSLRTSSTQMAHAAYESWFLNTDALLRSKAETAIESANLYLNQPNLQAQVQYDVAQLRLAYKAIEWWAAFHFPEYCEEYLNGAPVMQSARLDNRSFAKLPEGLQVIDEAVWEPSLDDELKSKTAQDILQFRNRYFILRNHLKDLSPKPKEASTAMRLGIVRLFSLGLSGFDTPGSLNALAESAASLRSMQECLPWLHFEPGQIQKLDSLFHFGIITLNQAQSFESFDRLHFLKQVVNPLYAALYEPGQQPNNRGWNPESKSLFDPHFLNPYFFTELTLEEDSKELRALGQQLFNDVTLSKYQNLSCATCHPSHLAFQDGLPKSESNQNGTQLERNTPGLINSVFADRYFYDLRAYTLEQQAEHVIFNASEFATNYNEIIERLNAQKAYRKAFKKALGKKQIERADVQAALASYVLSLTAFNSPFDRYVRNESESLNPDAIRGFNLFMGKAACGTCHFAPLFSGLLPPEFRKSESEVIGVLSKPIEMENNPQNAGLDADLGRYNNGVPSEQLQAHKHAFKTTGLRNAQKTAPYFHNGAYPSMKSVLNFYNHGGAAGLGLDLPIQTLAADSLHLTTGEIQDLEAFINSLTDVPPY